MLVIKLTEIHHIFFRGACYHDVIHEDRSFVAFDAPDLCSATVRRPQDVLIGHHAIPLKEQPSQQHLEILGISDHEAYANALQDKFAYLNTFMHKEPKADLI